MKFVALANALACALLALAACDSGADLVAPSDEAAISASKSQDRDAELLAFEALLARSAERVPSEGETSRMYIVPDGVKIPIPDVQQSASESFPAKTAGKIMEPGEIVISGSHGLSFSPSTVTGSTSTSSNTYASTVRAGADVDYFWGVWTDRMAGLLSVSPSMSASAYLYGDMITGLSVNWRNQGTHNATIAGELYSVYVAPAYGTSNY